MPGFVVGQRVKEKDIAKVKSKYIRKDEIIVGVFDGNRRPDVGISTTTDDRQRNSSLRGATLVITNQRVIMWMRGLLTEAVETIEYDKISNLEHREGLISGEVSFNIHGARERFRDMPKGDATFAAELLRKQLAEFTKKRPAVRPEDDALSILKKRYAKGEISKKDYQEMKKELER